MRTSRHSLDHLATNRADEARRNAHFLSASYIDAEVVYQERCIQVTLQKLNKSHTAIVYKAYICWSSLLRLWLSGVTLPRVLILKVYEPAKDPIKARREELECYADLTEIQGVSIPRCFGAMQLQEQESETPALAIQFLYGKTLFDLSSAEDTSSYDSKFISDGINKTFEDISRYGVMQEDCEFDKLDNFKYAHRSTPEARRLILLLTLLVAIWIIPGMPFYYRVIQSTATSSMYLTHRFAHTPAVFMIDLGYTSRDPQCLRTNLASARNLGETFVKRTEAKRKQSL